ncbi:MAG: pentapeptide repeat-containing protein, partial [Pseudomonadota bacterium]
LRGAVLRRAVLRRADLRRADLEGAVLRRADLRRADLRRADVRSYDIKNGRIVYSGADTNDGSAPEYTTDLSQADRLTQPQLDSMRGDRWTKVPTNLKNPWLNDDSPPALAVSRDPGTDVAEDNGRLELVSATAPDRADLATIYGDLREDIGTLGGAGSFSNISPSFEVVFRRFVDITSAPYEQLDQIRFGVQSTSLRLRFDAERSELEAVAPEKIGALEAALLSAELLTARLPEWQAFLSETAEERPALEDQSEIVSAALAEAEEAMEKDPDHFDPQLPEWLEEYRTTQIGQSLMAGVAILKNAAFTTFKLVRDMASETMSEARKLAVKGLATTFVGALGAALGKLAGVVPAELHWTLAWLKYIPTIF